MTNRLLSRIDTVALGVACLLFALWSAIFIFKTSFVAIDGQRYFSLFDDGMISMRYAWNASHGNGLVWNPGEYVEGYSNLLMTLLMAVATFLFSKPLAVLVIQLLGIPLMLGSAFVTARIFDLVWQDQPYRKPGRVLCFGGVLAYYPLVYWSLMGMETGLLTLLLLSSVFFSLRYTGTPNKWDSTLIGLMLGLAHLTRNDSAVFAFPIFAFVLWSAARAGHLSATLRNLVLPAAILVLFVVGQTLFRVSYYGDLLPNTYVLKLTGLTALMRLENGLGFIRRFLIESALLLGGALLGLCLRPNRANLFLAAFVLVALGYQVSIGGDAWDYWRLLTPVMPVVLVLYIQAILALAIRFANVPKFRRHELAVTAIVLLTILGVGMADYRFRREILFLSPPYQASDNVRNVNQALALNEIRSAPITVGVFWAGAIPYYTGAIGIDFLGKADKYIANLPPDIEGGVAWYGMTSVPGHNKYDLNYSLVLRQPTFVQLLKWGRQDLREWAKGHYVTVKYRGVTLILLKNSPAIRWDLVEIQ